MIRSVLLTAFGTVLCLVLPLQSTLAQCGVERWQIKTGTDSDAALVNLNSTVSTTVANLSAFAAPNPIPETRRVAPAETTVWVLNATLKKFVRSYDSDYHMVLTDDAGRTMIAEIPATACVGPGSPLAAGIAHARAQFDAMFTPTASFQNANIPVQITGVGFFDFAQGQEGLAPNAIELHPVIDILFNPSFSLSASSSVNINQGASGTASVSSTLAGNFSAPVSLSISGLPSGVSANFYPTNFGAPGSGTSQLTIAVGSATPIGTYGLTVTGTGGGQSHSATINLTVTSSTATQLVGNPGFESGAASPLPWIVTPDVIDNSSYEAPHTGSWKAWLNGYGIAHTDTILQQASVPSNAVQALLSFWLHIDTLETGNQAKDTLRLQIRNSSGAVLATLATYSNVDANTGYRQVSFDLTSYKGQTIQIYLIGVENTKLKTSFVVDDFALNVATASAPGDFVISASPSAFTVTPGASGTSSIGIALTGSFNSSISLSASGLPLGATAGFSPAQLSAPGAGTSLLTVSTGSATLAGTYTLTITGTGGGKTHSTTINLMVITGSGSTQQLLTNAGFENGSTNPAPWTATAGVVDNNSASEPAHSGSWKAWLNGFGVSHTDTIWQGATISSTATSATLSFWLHIDTTETSTTNVYDSLSVQIRNSSGTVLKTLGTYSNLNAAAGYSQLSFDLTSFKGQTIRVYLVGVEDDGLKTSFVADDFSLNVTTP